MAWITSSTPQVELRPDVLDQAAGQVGAMASAFGGIGIRLEVDNGEGVVERVEDRSAVDPCL